MVSELKKEFDLKKHEYVLELMAENHKLKMLVEKYEEDLSYKYKVENGELKLILFGWNYAKRN